MKKYIGTVIIVIGVVSVCAFLTPAQKPHNSGPALDRIHTDAYKVFPNTKKVGEAQFVEQVEEAQFVEQTFNGVKLDMVAKNWDK